VSFRYGPFPLRPGRFFGALAGFAVALVVSLVALETQHFDCDFGARNTCTITTHVSNHDDARFAAGDVQSVWMETVRRGKGKGAPYGVVVLKVPGKEYRLIDTDPDEARAIVARIESARSSRSEFHLTLTGSRWLLLFGALFALMGASMAWVAVKRIGSFGLSIEHDGSLVVERRILGMAITARSLALHGVGDVALEWGQESDFWTSRREAPRPAGRIVLVFRDRRVPLTDALWPGQTVHYRAAVELRRSLGFPPGALDAELHALENTLLRPALARGPGAMFGLVWLGACCGILVGLAALLLGLWLLGLMKPSDGIEPWMLIVGCGGGAVAGVGLVLHLARPRPPP
jgi:hypothetical protein